VHKYVQVPEKQLDENKVKQVWLLTCNCCHQHAGLLVFLLFVDHMITRMHTGMH